MKHIPKEIDLFEDGNPENWRRQYWKDKLKNPDIVDKISHKINTAEIRPDIKKDKQNDFFFDGSTETVLKKRNLHEESKDFFKAQLDMTKDLLPKETMADKTVNADPSKPRLDLFDQQVHRNEDFTVSSKNEMTMTPPEAFQKIYPSGNPNPQSAALKPTSSIAECPTGAYSGSDWAPQGKVTSLQLEEKSGASNPMGDNYLPDNAWNGPGKIKPPITQLSSGWDGQKFDDGGFQAGIGTNNKDKRFNNLGELLQKYLEEHQLNIKKDV